MEGDLEDEVEDRKQNEWIWEYVLKHCKNFRVATLLLDAIPLPDSVNIRKIALLKLISLDTQSGSFKDRDLYALQGLEDLDSKSTEKYVADDALSKLQLMVKAELVLQCVRNERTEWVEYSESLDRHWGEVVQDTEDNRNDSATDSMMNEIKGHLIALRDNHGLKESILIRYPHENIGKMMKDYLHSSWDKLGATFLEAAESDIKEGGPYRWVTCSRGQNVKRRCIDDNDDDDDGVDVERRNLKETRVRKILLPRLEVPNASAEDDDEDGDFNLPPWNGKYISSMLHTTDDEKIRRKLVRRLPEVNNFISGDKELDEKSKPDEDNEAQVAGNSPSSSTQPVKTSSVTIKEETSNSGRRRKFNKWTTIEEETLKKEVEKNGKGFWKMILLNNLNVFQNRTEVDLKDKWRNIEKYQKRSCTISKI